MAKTGILLINLGTPDAPTPEKVGSYLREFLMDPQVVDIPWIFRWIFVNALIVPRRKIKSAKLYQKIWQKNGSPLLTNTRNLTLKIAKHLPTYQVEFAMRYGAPSIKSVLEKMNVDDLIVVPLYPQYALSSTQSSIDECLIQIKNLKQKCKVRFMPPFYGHSLFINTYKEMLANFDHANFDHVLMSFHGLPKRHLTKLSSTCFQNESCCDKISDANKNCYRAQSFATARALAEKLEIPKDKYSVTFQSRLGRTEWIKPYTDVALQELPLKNKKNIAVLCPSFVSDCLETLEEIDIRGRADFKNFGGEELTYLPCLNDHEVWAKNLAKMISEEKFH